jgi:putative membrane protein
MIKRYSDHAANERTYLAWIRTAIAIMAFGFLIEKFNLFVDYIGKSIGNEGQLHATVSAEFVGIGAMVVGILIIVSATVRFYTLKRLIESDEVSIYSGRKTHALLSLLMVSMGLFVLFYMIHRVL